MRRLASFDDPVSARALCDVLYAANIDSDLREGPDSEIAVWVLAENDMSRAQSILETYVARPHAHELEAARALGQLKRAEDDRTEERDDQAAPEPPPVPRTRRALRERIVESPITFGMVGVSVVVAFTSLLGERSEVVSQFAIASFEARNGLPVWHGYRDLMEGQLWRLVTPIFLHFGLLHLVFNAFWLIDLGAPTERFQGSVRYTLFILWTAAFSNLAQFVFGHSPTFGGLSGVVYALVGYLWARGRADPGSGIYLPGRLVVVFIVLMAIGFSGLLDRWAGGVANYCHLGGLVAGTVYGYLAALRGRRRAQ